MIYVIPKQEFKEDDKIRVDFDCTADGRGVRSYLGIVIDAVRTTSVYGDFWSYAVEVYQHGLSGCVLTDWGCDEMDLIYLKSDDDIKLLDPDYELVMY